jgi:cytosine/adenosine deaminase-related metal-dependent hydrolase
VAGRRNGLAAGDRADFVVFRFDAQRRDIQVDATYVSGRRVFG